MTLVVLFHYGEFQPLWQQRGLLQCGPHMAANSPGIHVIGSKVPDLQKSLLSKGVTPSGVLVHYIDPFLIRASPLTELDSWVGPKLLVCGDLHHGPNPIGTLATYQAKEFHDAVLVSFNPALLNEVRSHLAVPVHSMPPGFFRYPTRPFNPYSQNRLIHVGSLGIHHPQRRQIVTELLERKRIPFIHTVTRNNEEAADLYNGSALVLNIPLNNDLNHRFFEIMSAGSRQIIFGHKQLLGPHYELATRKDVFWVQTID